MTIRVRVRGTDPPGLTCGGSADQPEGYRNVHAGLQRGREVEDRSPGDRPFLAEIEVAVRNGKFSGPYVHGQRGDRFLYLSWGELQGDVFKMFRRAKIRLEHLDPMELDGRTIEVALSLSDGRGHPVCATVRPPHVTWTVDP